jgi:hypothetical protein
MKKLLIATVYTILCVVLCPSILGQNNERDQNISKSNYNIPPGVVFGKKFNTNLDLSFKLNESTNFQSYKDSELRVGKKLSKEQLESLKEIDKINYEYYTIANSFFDSLSKKVKELFTMNELWYIYVFDQNLKNKLITIK